MANSVEPEYTLASVQTIKGFEDIPKADRIQLATFRENAWKVIVKKGEFSVGDKAIYFMIGSLLDADNPDFEFLAGKPLKTKKMMGVYSQGLCMPVSVVEKYGIDPDSLQVNQDVTSLLKVKKWISANELEAYDSSGSTNSKTFPPFVPKTDEPRIQNCTARLEEIIRDDLDIVMTLKYDGTSTTFVFMNGTFVVCGRNYVITNEPGPSCYWEMANKYNLAEKMAKLGRNLAIQGETIGVKINGNRMKIKETDFAVFNIFDIDYAYYLSWDEVEKLCNTLGLKTVFVLYKGKLKKEWQSVESLLGYANSLEYSKGVAAEGFVLKTNYGTERPRISFKVISNEYLAKYGL